MERRIRTECNFCFPLPRGYALSSYRLFLTRRDRIYLDVIDCDLIQKHYNGLARYFAESVPALNAPGNFQIVVRVMHVRIHSTKVNPETVLSHSEPLRLHARRVLQVEEHISYT